MAYRKCCVGGCVSTSKTHCLFNLPKDDGLRKLWLSFLIPTNVELSGLSKDQLVNKRVCHDHFDRYQFDGMGNRLKNGYPCLFTPKEIYHGVPLSACAEDHLSDHNYVLQMDIGDEDESDENDTSDIVKGNIFYESLNSQVPKGSPTVLEAISQLTKEINTIIEMEEIVPSKMTTTSDNGAHTPEKSIYRCSHSNDQEKPANCERTSRLLANEDSHPQRTYSKPLSSGFVRRRREVNSLGDLRRQRRTTKDAGSKKSLAIQEGKDESMASVLKHQTLLFNKLIEMQEEQSRKIDELKGSSSMWSIIDKSHNSAPDSTYITESESNISKADALAQQGAHCQRLGKEDWNNIHYAHVQKQFQATPVFSSLKVNNLLAEATPNVTSSSLLEKFDLTLGAITNGLLQQRKIFGELFDNLPKELKHKEFFASNSKFRKSSDDLLQYVCGRRAETIQQRRDTYKINNKSLHKLIHSIPPSETHLFKEPDLSQAVKDQGGIQKFFPLKNAVRRSSRVDYKT
ncbi:uncharacterized protein LOC106139307 isoform X1 [Amyelois transitella]|uniref:uncharacterized protein LOC106139307 isoform X1 n=1 Tax=Amyelois transitella TaxID=680683 RepID=UPI00298FC5B5|nr:uncharacterized protein LOC106139307 isoform X1 [Amyelois transitella]